MPAGRPSKYKPEFCDLLIEHMTTGMSYESFAGHDDVNVCDDTLREWEKNYPEFSAAKKSGVAKCLAFWEKIGINNMNEPNFKDAHWYRNMRNRFRKNWYDKSIVHNINEIPTINVIDYSKAEVDE